MPAKENQDRRELQDKQFPKKKVPVHDSLGGPVPQLGSRAKLPARFLLTVRKSYIMRRSLSIRFNGDVLHAV